MITKQLFGAMLFAALFGAVPLAVAQTPPPAAAPAVPNQTVRGVITGFDGKVLSVKDRDGKDLKIDAPDTVVPTIAKAFSMADIKPGMILAVTTLKRADGVNVALDVRPLPPTVNVNSFAYDLRPGSLMNNANVDAMVKGAEGDELTLNYKTGTIKALVTKDTNFSQPAPGTRDDLKVGETMFASVHPEGGDKFTLVRVQVSKDGVKPGQ